MEATMEIRCSFCNKHMGYKDGKGITGISHGCCKECYTIQMEEIENEKIQFCNQNI